MPIINSIINFEHQTNLKKSSFFNYNFSVEHFIDVDILHKNLCQIKHQYETKTKDFDSDHKNEVKFEQKIT